MTIAKEKMSDICTASLKLNAQKSIVIIDLNNFATFPTLAVGIIVAALRKSGFRVKVFCPLAHDVPATERERPETFMDHLMRRAYLSTYQPFRIVRDFGRRVRLWWKGRTHPRVLKEVAKILDTNPDMLLISAYLQHYRTVRELCALCQVRGIPILLGGPAFNQNSTANAWSDIPGLTAIVGSEVDIAIPAIVEATITGGNLLDFGGVTLPDGRKSPHATPLRYLDSIPIPDFTDFPWDRYRIKIIPIMTGRGCQWNRCVFCNDISSVSGRTFRNKSIERVLYEIRELSERHGSKYFSFLDLKLNSNPPLYRELLFNIQSVASGAEWVGSVHVDSRKDNGLSLDDLRAAAAAGMRRISFGLESGSQRLLDLMEKGCSVESNSEFIHNAHTAGISVRCTMMCGFPGERASDLIATAEFLERHIHLIDRVRFNEFSILAGTHIYNALLEEPTRYTELQVLNVDDRLASVQYINHATTDQDYRIAKKRVLAAVYKINKRELSTISKVFDGIM